MTPLFTLIEELKLNNIRVESIEGNRVKLEKKYEISAEGGGIYNLILEDVIINSFSTPGELCRFILK